MIQLVRITEITSIAIVFYNLLGLFTAEVRYASTYTYAYAKLFETFGLPK